MPRLFTGIQIPENIRQRLMLIKSGLTGATWISPENYHITLRFVGDIENPTAEELTHALENVSCEPFSIRILGFGSFGGNRPRTVWADVDGNDELQNLHRSHECIVRAIGLPEDARNFVPHITLARLKRGNVDEVAEFLENFGDFKSEWFEVNNFVLFSSRSNRGGGPYAIEAIYPLQKN